VGRANSKYGVEEPVRFDSCDRQWPIELIVGLPSCGPDPPTNKGGRKFVKQYVDFAQFK
jgi:hypothetical protein